MRRSVFSLLFVAIASGSLLAPSAGADEAPLKLNLRLRSKSGQGEFVLREKQVTWNPKKTALIVCDMWDDHWCRSAARRVTELAGPMDEVLRIMRGRGVLILHCPSSVTDFYKGTPQRQRAQNAPFAPTPVPLSTVERWGTCWCWPDATREPVLPIDDSDMGCDCAVKCKVRDAWTRQIAMLHIAADDAITDQGQEVWNLLEQRGIEHVLICGVHLNMCVLGRPFGIRQMVKLGKDVVLLRDLTDTMYNPERPPGANHFRGTALVVEHVEKYWCPSCTSHDLTGKPAFRFQGAPPGD
jgi:hypothetical protein